MKLNNIHIMVKCRVAGMLVLLAVACILLIISSPVRCDIPIGMSTINVGPLSLDAAAVAKLSNSPNQDAWWQLADEVWHDSAMDRFFSTGPLNAIDRTTLAKHHGNKDAWKFSGINNNTTPPEELIRKLQHAATTEYTMNKFITGTGDIVASMWTLMFYCKSSDCKDGYMAPIVVVRNPSNQSRFSYATVWLPATDKVLMNAIPASFSGLQVSTKDVDPDKLGIFNAASIRIHDQLSQCHTDPVNAIVYRTLIDSAYGLAPPISCVGFSEDKSFKVVVVDGDEQSQGSTYFDQESSWPFDNVSSGGVVSLEPLEQCPQAPLMMVNASPHNRMLCHYGRCISFRFKPQGRYRNVKDYPWQYSDRVGRRSTRFPIGTDSDLELDRKSTLGLETAGKAEGYTTSSESKIYMSGLKALKSMLTFLNSSSQCKNPNITVCSTSAYDEAEFDNLHPLDSFKVTSASDHEEQSWFIGASKWVSNQGRYTLDFKYAALDKLNACYRLLESPSLYAAANSSEISPPQEFKIQGMAHLTSYTTEQHTAVTMDKGPATDPYTFYALIVSTAISVIGIAVPFTDFMLHKECLICHSYLHSSGQAIKIIVHVFCNVVLSLASLLPVISQARNELDRQNAFSTWALASDDLVFDQFSLDSTAIRVFYLFSATSKYNSNFLTVILLVVCCTCIIVAASTARRCLQVFQRYASLGQLGSESSLLMMALKAIEMGEAEYLDRRKGLEAVEAIERGEAEKAKEARPTRSNLWSVLRALTRFKLAFGPTKRELESHKENND